MAEGVARAFEEALADIEARMGSQLMTSRTLLGGMRLIDESSRASSQYQDPNYLPFYFHVGRVFDPKRVACIGLDIGLHVSCLLRGCSSPERAVCVQSPSGGFYSPRLAISNIKSVAGRRFPVEVHIGRVHDALPQGFLSSGFDAAIITCPCPSDDLMEAMDFCWRGLDHGGVMVVDHLVHKNNEEVFKDFCLGRSARHGLFRTRYRAGMATR